MPASFAPGQQEVELDRSPIYAGKNRNPVQRARRLGTGRRGMSPRACPWGWQTTMDLWSLSVWTAAPLLSIGPWSNVVTWRLHYVRLNVCPRRVFQAFSMTSIGA